MKTSHAKKTRLKEKAATTVAVRIAGEDIKPGDFVSVLSEVIELPSYLWCCSEIILPADEPVRARYIPREAGQPYKVFAICLPFVYLERPIGGVLTIDLRRIQLVRLDPKVGGGVWKRLRQRSV